MAEIIENGTMEVVPSHQHIPSNCKVNAALTTGIIGTALGGLSLLGNGAMMCNRNNQWCGNPGFIGYAYPQYNDGMYVERKESNDCLELTKQNYEGRLENQAALASAFFETWKRDADNSFGLYKSQRDGDDIIINKLNEAAFGLYKSQRDGFDIANQKMIDASFNLYKGFRDGDDVLDKKINESAFGLYKNQRDGFDIVNQKLTDAAFGLYKSQRDTKDEIKGDIGATNQKITDVAFGLYKEQRDNKDKLEHKINCLENKLDVLTAVRPYQDALINARIDKNELMSDFKLAKRTSRMIEGRLVLPTDVISGSPSYNYTMTV